LLGTPEPVRLAEALRLNHAEARRPFDLERGPLFRARMVLLAAGDQIVMFNVHHIASDDWSSGVFVRELAALYPAALEGRPVELPALAVQYADFAAWQRRWLDGELLDRRLEAVRAALAGAPLAIELPLDRPRPMEISYRGDDYKFQLAAETEARVRALAQASGASPFMVLLAGFATLVGRLAETEDLLIG